MNVARSVYKAASDAEKFEAYYNLQDAEVAYYGTDEGRSSLIACINENVDSPNRDHWLSILERADQKREFVEGQLASFTDKQGATTKPILRFNQNMRVEEYNGRKYVALATGSYPDGTGYNFDWDQTSGAVTYEEKDDIDSMRMLGIAKDIGAAKNLCQHWYEKNKIQITT